jgi:hypothetical protein
MMAEYKTGLRKEGVKPPVVEAAPVKESREYRKAPEERLMARLGLSKYDVQAPLSDNDLIVKEVKIMLSQHIGAPAVSIVENGQQVNAGDVIAKANDGLSVAIHASVTGVVKEVTEKYILITTRS